MAQASKRLRRARKLKRSLTLHKRAIDQMFNENQVYREMLTEIRVRELKAKQAAEESAESLIVKPTLKQIVQSEFSTEKPNA